MGRGHEPFPNSVRRVGKKEVRLKIYDQTLSLIPGLGLIQPDLTVPQPGGGGRGASGPCLPLIFPSPGPEPKEAALGGLRCRLPSAPASWPGPGEPAGDRTRHLLRPGPIP